MQPRWRTTNMIPFLIKKRYIHALKEKFRRINIELLLPSLKGGILEAFTRHFICLCCPKVSATSKYFLHNKSRHYFYFINWFKKRTGYLSMENTGNTHTRGWPPKTPGIIFWRLGPLWHRLLLLGECSRTHPYQCASWHCKRLHLASVNCFWRLFQLVCPFHDGWFNSAPAHIMLSI